jgi:hypothetical protein
MPPLLVDASRVEFSVYCMEVACSEKSSTEENSRKEDPQEAPELIPSSSPPAAPAAVPATWSCPMCTFHNGLSSHRCGMCDTINPNRNSSIDEDIIDAQENRQATPSDFAVWMCGQCTFMNQIDSIR